MRTLFLIISLVFCFYYSSAKPPKKKKKDNHINLDEIIITPTNEFTDYQATRTRDFDLLHTKIEIEPILQNKTANGKATLTIKPYFYPKDELILDAKYMQINDIILLNKQKNQYLSYNYDSLQLKIYLGKQFTSSDTLTILIDYIAKPYSISESVLDIDGRGMYFINAENKNPYKPFHLWTQGEVEANSFWFPTIDAPNERCSQEIFVTLDTAYISLSNGILVSSTNKGNKRIDYWKQDKQHAPYLFFLGIGDYKKYQTTWRNIDVDYYTFKDYYQDVQEVFGNTPEMLTFYSNLLKVDFPWDKYAQIIAFDYTAGAMENSSAVILYDKLLMTHQDLLDDNYDFIIAHELFHHWFGDLVTAESWANLTLNESFADYGEYLWANYKYGKDNGDAVNKDAFEKYLKQSKYKNEPLVDYYYKAHKDMFDGIRYEKGGRILHLLRNYIGDEAFFKALNLYLVQNQFNSAEPSDFRKVIESVTGKDWNWFFNQWYFDKGHPILDIQYTYHPETKNIEVKIKQIQDKNTAPIFKIPTTIDIYFKDSILRKELSIINKESTFYFPAKTKPLFINFDPEGVLPAELKENLTESESALKFDRANSYYARSRVLNSFVNNIKGNKTAQDIFIKAIQHSDWNTQKEALSLIYSPNDFTDKNLLNTVLKELIYQSSKADIRKMALNLLNKNNSELSFAVAQYVIQKDSSLQCIAAALDIVKTKNFASAYQEALPYLDTKNPTLLRSIGSILKDTTINHLDFFKKAIWLNNYRNAYQNFENLSDFLMNTQDENLFQDAINFLSDINHYEESNFNIDGSIRICTSLRNKLEYQENNKKTDKYLLPLIAKKLEILNKAIPQLKGNNLGF